MKISQRQDIKPSGCSCAKTSQFYFKENHSFYLDVTSPKLELGSQTCTLSPSYLLHFVHFILYLLDSQCLCWQLTHPDEGQGFVKCCVLTIPRTDTPGYANTNLTRFDWQLCCNGQSPLISEHNTKANFTAHFQSEGNHHKRPAGSHQAAQ